LKKHSVDEKKPRWGNNDSIVVLAAKLFLICLAVALGLAFLNSVTSVKIDESQENEKKIAMEKLVAGADDFIPINDRVYRGTAAGKTVGYAVTASPNGYGGAIDMLIGFNENYEILGIDFIGSMSETPGLGALVKEDGFKSRFAGKKDTVIVKNKPEKDNEIEAITGATISSNAVNAGVNEAAEVLKEVLSKQ
jgi:electron transport complex protein RnfG